MVYRTWDRLPSAAKRFLPSPSRADYGHVPRESSVVSIFWAWIDPATGKPTVSPSGEVLMITDSGKQEKLDTPYPFDAYMGGNFRQIYIDPPPRDQRSWRPTVSHSSSNA